MFQAQIESFMKPHIHFFLRCVLCVRGFVASAVALELTVHSGETMN